MKKLIVVLTSLAGLMASGPPAGAAALMSTYPMAPSARLAEQPTSFKLYAGAGWRNLSWKSWGTQKAVARGTVFDHPSLPGGIKAKGQLIASRPRQCGTDVVYTRFRHKFTGRSAKRAKYLKSSTYKVTLKAMKCQPGGTNAVVHVPTIWAQLGPYPTADNMFPEVHPSMITLTNHGGLTKLVWTSWGAETATATGTALVENFFEECLSGERCERTASVQVTATDLGHCGTFKTYRTVTFVETPASWTGLGGSPLTIPNSLVSC